MEITKETLLEVVSFLTNDKLNSESLTDFLGDDLQDGKALFAAIKPAIIDYKNEYRKEILGKGYRQASKKTERLIKEVFPDVEFESEKQEDMFIHLRDVQRTQQKTDNSKAKTPKELSWEDALKFDSVRTRVQELQEKASKVDEVQSSYDSFKRYVGIKDLSLGYLNEAGAQLNPKSKIYNLQMQAIQKTLSQVQTKDINGVHYILDEEGDIKINPDTAKQMTLKEYVINNSPVDFAEQPAKREDKKIHTPSKKGNGNANPYNYAKDHSFTAKEHAEALKEGNPQKAEYIKQQLYKQAEAKTNE